MWWILAILACQEQSKYGDWQNRGDWSSTTPAVLVRTEVIGTGTVTNTIEITGALESIEQVNIIPETTGVVQSIFVREGDVVRKGDVLAKIINTNASATLERSQIEMERLEREWNKTQRLRQDGAISDREFEEVNTQLKTAKTSREEALAAQNRTTIRSPINGVVALVNIREGEVATSTQLFQVVQPERLRLIASVPERDLTELKEGQAVDIRAAYNDNNTVDGLVERIAPVVDPTTGSVRVFINVEEGQNLLRPGQFVKAQVEVASHENTIVLPKEAVVYEDGAPIAYVVAEAPTEEPSEKVARPKEDDIKGIQETQKAKLVADRRELTVGFSDIRVIEITEGVKVGEQVITIGNHTLEDDSPITLEDTMQNKEISAEKTTNDAVSEDDSEKR